MKFDFHCLKCDTVFEVELRIGIEPPKVPCPKCKSKKTRKVINSAPQIQFKGKGFYSTDNKK